MTVVELIEKLKAMPQDAKVILAHDDGSKWDREVRDVIYNDPTKVRCAQHTVELDNWPAEDF